jgi:DNA-binding transcriptional regulator YiaG
MGRRTTIRMTDTPHFAAWLRKQGTTRQERADTLGLSARCIQYWEQGARWPTVEALKNHPDALRALADDLEGHRNGHR